MKSVFPTLIPAVSATLRAAFSQNPLERLFKSNNWKNWPNLLFVKYSHLSEIGVVWAKKVPNMDLLSVT